MNSKVFSMVGWTLMILSVLAIVYALIILPIIDSNPDFTRKINHLIWSGLVPMVVVFILTFFPGKIYYNISKKEKSNRLENWSAFLVLVSLVLLILLLLFSILTSSDFTGVVWGIVIFGGFLLIPYVIGILLLVINWFKSS